MSAEGGSGMWSGLLELEAVSKRVERVEPVHALYLAICAHRLVARQPYRSFNGIKVVHDKGRMGLACGAKIRLDAKVKDGRTSREPAATARRQRSGLGPPLPTQRSTGRVRKPT